ncbi:MAG TPA: hypothetical protein PLM07_17090 [Candidatus Rifleibacterium sp.]|nr:hypothetical protein [Candidatus Rifleibacterium sp.]HPT47596.1 hypothetical protein [Candidatus Rifleibacterium sp.]
MKRAVLLLAAVLMSITPCMAGEPVEQSNLQCLVIGQEADPARGREFFKQAMQAWNHGQKSEALELYESAIIADHSILRHEDHGLAMALLEKYRDPARSNDLTTLCRRGFFENILVGNLESSIRFYEEAAQVATSDNDRQLAADEAVRLREQLSYITEWQKGIEQANRQLRARDLVEYEQAGRIAELQDQLEDGSGELEELQERLAYLQKQEKEALEGMYSSVRSAARYRRQHYYPGAYQTGTPDPSAATFPEGSWGGDNSPNQGQVANPYAGQPDTGVSSDAALNRFYVYRGRARRQQDQLDQIRAEISGLQRRIAQTEKSMRDLRQKASNEAVK